MSDVVLDWQGPIAVGQRLPTSREDLEFLNWPGVYLWCRTYQDNQMAVYVGKAQSIEKRLQQWFSQFLSWRHFVRKPDGTEFCDGSRLAFFKNLANLDAASDAAKSEVRLTRFYWALTDRYNDIEGSLIQAIRKSSAAGDTVRILFEQRQPKYDHGLILQHNFQRLTESANEFGTLRSILQGRSVAVIRK